MKISAKIIADSFCHTRLTTFLLTFPRYILSELNTHCMLVRNAASSRAIPVEKRLEQVHADPAGPIWWGANRSGMQATIDLEASSQNACLSTWRQAGLDACRHAHDLAERGLHKQAANRVLEPYAWCSNLTTGTEWANFFNLRCTEEAQPEFDYLAGLMLQAYVASEPRRLQPGEWHLPFGDRLPQGSLGGVNSIELGGVSLELLSHLPGREEERLGLLVSAARCARLSYETHDGEFSVAKDLQLAERLLSSGHMSPFGHQAQAVCPTDYAEHGISGAGMHFSSNVAEHLQAQNALWDGRDLWWGQFRWWRQFRKILPGENRSTLDPAALLSAWRARWATRRPDLLEVTS